MAHQFCPPRGFDGEEQGQYEDDFYERSLSWEEEQVVLTRAATELAVRLAYDAECRNAWFGFGAAGDDDGEGDDGKGEGDAPASRARPDDAPDEAPGAS